MHVNHQRAGPQRLNFSLSQAGRKTVVNSFVLRDDGGIGNNCGNAELLRIKIRRISQRG